MRLVSPFFPDGEACASWLEPAGSVLLGHFQTLAIDDAILYRLFFCADTVCDIQSGDTLGDGPNLFSALTSMFVFMVA